MTPSTHKLFAISVALALPALLAVVDFGTSLFCNRAPLYCYLGAAVLGVVLGVVLDRKLAGSFRKMILRLAIVLVGAGTAASVWLTLRAPNWGSQCAHRYCDRALGVAFDRSPFPVGVPSCADLHVCANEYPYAAEGNRRLRELMRERGCAQP